MTLRRTYACAHTRSSLATYAKIPIFLSTLRYNLNHVLPVSPP